MSCLLFHHSDLLITKMFLKKELDAMEFCLFKFDLWKEQREFLATTSLSFTSRDSMENVRVTKELQRAKNCLNHSLDRYFIDGVID